MSSNKDICKIVAFKCLKKQLDLWFYMLLSRVLTLSQILKKLQQRQKWHNVHFLRFLQEICILCDLAPWDYKSQVWNNSSDATTDKTHYVMTVWLVFWSKRVCNALIRPSPVIGGRSGGDRDAIHTVTLYHQNDFNIYKESPSRLFDSRHHMNALRLSVTSRETKTKCFHRERTVKLEEEKGKKKVKHILWLRCIHRESHRRREISSSPPLRWISAGGRDVQLSDSASLRDLFMKSEASISNGDV